MTYELDGRELAGIKNGRESYTYAYNLSGLRTSKTVHGTSTNYYYDGNDNLISTKRVKLIVMFYYDSNGEVYSMTKGDKTYFFIKNLQGDITKIIDEEGNVCATYLYDAWGAILEENEDSSIKGANPFRYRGYVYDSETGLYYLQSRYYDPQTGRFINADSENYVDTESGSPLSTNMFAYCENNHTMGYDPSGNWGKTLHGEMCKSVGFSKTTCEWVEFADGLFSSDGDYSAPFHSRARKTNNGTVVVEDGLQCAKYLYNLAIDLRSQYQMVKINQLNLIMRKKAILIM